jgi:hypothetical protein
MSHAQIGCREEVDSRLLVVGSQTASLTPGPSFAHNLGCRCPNRQCEGIFDIYVSRPFQWHQEHPNARCFAPCCRALNIRESRKTPNLQLFQVLGFTPTLGQSGVATASISKNARRSISPRSSFSQSSCLEGGVLSFASTRSYSYFHSSLFYYWGLESRHIPLHYWRRRAMINCL